MELTVSELRRILESYSCNDVLSFGSLKYYRLERRGRELLQIEYKQHVFLNPLTGELVVKDLEQPS